jgi:hypothetical protein
MKTFKKSIVAGTSTQFPVGNPLHDAFIMGKFSVTRGSKRQDGVISINAAGNFDAPYVGDDCGITITGSATRNKILIKVGADSSDSLTSSFEFNQTI